MHDQQRQDEQIEALLREVHESAAPADSWQALRGRIESRCRMAAPAREVVFWRGIAFAAAACFIVTATLLGYLLLHNHDTSPAPLALAKADPPLLDEAQTERLARAFSHVRSVFTGESPWFMVDSFGNSQLGLAQTQEAAGQSQKLIVLRLTLRDEQSQAQQPYADLVAFPQQRVDIQMRTAQGSVIEVSLVPVLGDNGRIAVDVVAGADDDSRATAVRMDESAFRSLVHIRVGVHRIALDATAKPVSVSEQG